MKQNDDGDVKPDVKPALPDFVNIRGREPESVNNHDSGAVDVMEELFEYHRRLDIEQQVTLELRRLRRSSSHPVAFNLSIVRRRRHRRQRQHRRPVNTGPWILGPVPGSRDWLYKHGRALLQAAMFFVSYNEMYVRH